MERIYLYVRDEITEQILTILRAHDVEETLDRFKNDPFGYLLQVRRQDNANNALQELVARELRDDSFS